MWRNVSWNSTESTLPEGMHKHETGAYFKTPSIQSVNSSQSGGTTASNKPSQTGAQDPILELGQEQFSPIMERPSAMASRTNSGQQQQQQQRRRTQIDSQGPKDNFQTSRVGAQSSNIHHGFRSRLSSISGALQPPKLAKRLFSGHHEGLSGDNHNQTAIQITTTSIDSPKHQQDLEQQQQQQLNASDPGHLSTTTNEHNRVSFFQHAVSESLVEAQTAHRPMSSSSGRRLSQLFLPNLGNLSHHSQLGVDPFSTAGELMPPHLLGLYGQAPLVGGIPQVGMGGHRASWADISLFGRLSNMRPSIDSSFHGRHSFDAHQRIGSEQCNEQELEERASCIQIMKRLFLSLLLGTMIALCWVMIIHTLKWIAIRGNEFEAFQQQYQGQRIHQSSPPPPLRLQHQNRGPMGAQELNGGELQGSASMVAPSIQDPPAPPIDDDDDDQASGGSSSLASAETNAGRAQHKRIAHAGSIAPSSSQRQPNTPIGSLKKRGPQNPVAGEESQGEIFDTAASDGSAVDEQPTTGGELMEQNAILDARNAPLATPRATSVYRAPFFTSWFVSIWNILFMPVFTLISSCCFRNEDSNTKKLLVRESISQFMDNGLTTLQFLGRCAFFSVLWIITIFGIVYSLSNIDATVVMALFACSAALVYLLSWVLLHQQFVGVRIVAVIICTTGIALLAYMDNSRTLGSVLMVTGSALCSAIYKVIYQRMFGFWSLAQMSLFFTLIGLFNAFIMWPIVLLLYLFGVELIAWRFIPWMHLIAAGVLHLTANVIAYFGPICSYDVFLTMGLLLAIILSAVIDITFYKIPFFGMKLAGVLLLMIGFLVCLLPENWNGFLYHLVNERFVRWKKRRNLKKSRNKVQDMSTGQISRLRTPSGRVK